MIEEGKILALDYGTVRIGIAISDSHQQFAHEHSVLRNNNEQIVFEKLYSLIQQEHVIIIIIGYPLDTSGGHTKMSDIIESFCERFTTYLQNKQEHVALIRWNETLTSYEAYENLLQKGEPHTKIKQHLDAEAARILLQEYLDNIHQHA